MGLRECFGIVLEVESIDSLYFEGLRGNTNDCFIRRRGFGMKGGCWVKECRCSKGAGKEW